MHARRSVGHVCCTRIEHYAPKRSIISTSRPRTCCKRCSVCCTCIKHCVLILSFCFHITTNASTATRLEDKSLERSAILFSGLNGLGGLFREPQVKGREGISWGVKESGVVTGECLLLTRGRGRCADDPWPLALGQTGPDMVLEKMVEWS